MLNFQCSILHLFSSPIHHTFGPHVTFSHALASLSLLLRPWRWQRGAEHEKLREALRQSLQGDAFLFSSGREAILALLKAIHLRSGEEVIIQGYTCVVVPNAIHAAGGTPIYADVDGDTLNLDCTDVEHRMTSRTRAVIAQHTFGIPADLTSLRTLCDERDILLIEDCAHVVPDDPSSPLARTGDFAILSFGRDKAISGVSGGAVISRKADTAQSLRNAEQCAGELSRSVIVRFLLYPLLYHKARALYVIGLGRLYLAFCKTLRLLVPVVTPEEKRGTMMLRLRKCPNACAALALHSLARLPHINAHRRTLTQFYINACHERGWNILPGIAKLATGNQQRATALQKFPLFFPDAEKIRASLQKHNIYLDDGWTGCVICPRSVDPGNCNYASGDDPHAEEVGGQIVSLPTHATMTVKQAQRLMISLANVVKRMENGRGR